MTARAWYTKQSKDLFKAFSMLENDQEAAKFCRDLMTEAEIVELAGRWAVARELNQGTSQRETSKRTGVSIATVTRVNQWLKRGMDGYTLMLKKFQNNISSHHPHQH